MGRLPGPAAACWLVVILFVAGCGGGPSTNIGADSPDVLKDYAEYIAELERLYRLPYRERDTATILKMTTSEWGLLVEDDLFEEPEVVQRSERYKVVKARVVTQTEGDAEISACNTHWPDNEYIVEGDRIGGGRQTTVGFRVEMVRGPDRWLVDLHWFDMRQCD